MIYSTLGELRAQLYARLGIPIDDTFLDTAQANRVVNAATQQVDLAHPWPWTVKTATIAELVQPEEGFYTMPDDYVTMISVSNLNTAGHTMRYLDRKPYDDVRIVWAASGGSTQTASSAPVMWAEHAHGMILTAPQAAPDVGLTFRYRGTSPVMSSDAASSLHPSRYDEMYTAYGAYLAGLRFRELPETGGALAQFDSLLERYQRVFPVQNFGGEALTAERGKVTPTERG